MEYQELIREVRFDDKGLVPAVVQDVRTGEVLMVAYMNQEALKLTCETRYATFFSRSRQSLWKKGETSGNVQKVCEIRLDCDGDTLLLLVEPAGPACHTGARSCFFRSMPVMDEDEIPVGSRILDEVYSVIEDRSAHPREGSYTNYLLDKGVEKICKKVGEEASETIIAAVKGSSEEVTYEAADLLYHLLVLLYQQGITPQQVYDELARRR